MNAHRSVYSVVGIINLKKKKTVSTRWTKYWKSAPQRKGN
jgi:hypothetical protein